ncbi:MAG TPA: hypothetical protein VFU15_14930 [Bacteroidia bacterium]|nr:hypothetical protein [Bacteroidia bacterium]
MKNVTRTTIILTALYSVLLFAGIVHHEMWLDETHHWLLARDSGSLRELFHNSRYEGHPMLWDMLLFLIARFTQDPFAMQVMNFIVSVTGVFLFLRYFPFNTGLKAVTVFSYFIFYEYGVISRNYAIAFLFLVATLKLFEDRRKHFLLFSVMLALLAQTHLFASVIAGGLFAFAAWENYFRRSEGRFSNFYAGATIVALSFLLLVPEIIPPADHFLFRYDPDPMISFKRFGKALSVLWKGLFPVPDFGSPHPWNSNWFISASKSVSVIPAALSWLVPGMLLMKKRPVAVFYYSTAFVIVLFIYFSPLIVASRHCGFFFLLLIAGLWMMKTYKPGTVYNRKVFRWMENCSEKYSPVILAVLFFCQLVSSVFLFYTDWKRPFSNGKYVAEWLKADAVKEPVLVSQMSAGPSICAYTGGTAFYPENNCVHSFCFWNTDPFIIPDDSLLVRAHRLAANDPSRKALLVLNFRLDSVAMPPHVRFVRTFTGAMVRPEDYYIYEAEP